MMLFNHCLLWVKNYPKGVNTMKNNMRRITRISKYFCINPVVFSHNNTRSKVSNIHYLLAFFFFFLRITFTSLKFLKQFSFVFMFLLRRINWNLFESIHLEKNMKTKETKRPNVFIFETSLSVHTKTYS